MSCSLPRTALFIFCLAATPAAAITGDAQGMAGAARAIVMITTNSSLCTGTAIARDIVLTAAHCVQQRNSLVRTSRASGEYLIREVAVHPRFDLQGYALHRATADVALIKLSSSLPSDVVPAPLARPDFRAAVGNRMTVAGFGSTASDTDRGLYTARSATLVVTGQPGSLQVRLYDPATRNERAGLGACTGDSGGPAFSGNAVAGIVSWTTGPGNSEGCGGLTGVTPLTLYRSWIVEQVRKMGGDIAP